MHYWYLDEIIRVFFLGLIDTQTLFGFFKKLPHPLWVLDCVEKLQASLESVIEAGQHQTTLDIHRICPIVPIVRFLELFKRNLTGEAKLRAERCWEELATDTIRTIIAGGEFIMESASRGELMYAPMDNHANKETRPVFTWADASYQHHGNTQERWKIIPVHETSNCFLIQNVKFGEYLYATFRSRPGREQSRVNLWRRQYNFDDDEKDMFYWQLVPLSRENRQVFALYNCYENEFLYAPDAFCDSKRRFVRTAQEKMVSIPQREWRLIPQL
ncbi:hypothetical protein PHMEG_00010425 [Phytophthora megakarya]|uniref:Uncharacterized protein n=1 Tax=Phytophthora megakarya TaxID=4795 RepID=A0A225WF42_9STRA|nr:hypothetical protein PHMEG_00010425 [Phytophthora megakarya]